MADGENPGPGRPEDNWPQSLADGLRPFRATEGSTENSPSLLLGVETMFWPRVVNKKSGKCYRGVVEAVNCFMKKFSQGRGGEKPAAPHS